MKKRVLSLLLAFSMALALLPSAALAAEKSYGPDEEGYAYTVDRSRFDLGTIEHDGSGLTKKDAFSYTVTNTGEKPITVIYNPGFGRWETMFRDSISYDYEIPLAPGECITFHYDMEVEAGAPTRTGAEDSWAQSSQAVLLGDRRDSVGLYVDFKIVNTSEEPEPTPTPTPGTSSGNQGGQTQPGGNWGGNIFVPLPSDSSGGQSTPVDISVSQAQSQLKLDFGSRKIDLGTIYNKPDKADRTLTITNNSAVEVAVGLAGGTGMLNVSGNKDNDVWLIKPGESRDYVFYINTETPKKGSDTLDLLVIVKPKTESYWTSPFYQVSYTAGDRYRIEGVYTVSYDIRSAADADVDYELSAKSVDFGTIYADKELPSKTITLTNTSPLTYGVSASAEWESTYHRELLRCRVDTWNLKPGEKATITLEPDIFVGGKYIGQDLTTTVNITLTRGKVTETIPVTVTFRAEKDTYSIYCENINSSWGYLATEGGEAIGRVKVKNGEDFTVVMYAPYGVPCALVEDGYEKKVILTTGDRYTFENVKEDHNLAAYFYQSDNVPADWAREAAAWFVVKGYSFYEFKAPIQRDYFCTLAYDVYQAAGNKDILKEQYSTVTFTDTESNIVRSLAYLGVINGVGDGKFNPNGQLTRQEAATILSRLAKVLGVELPTAQPTFADSGDIADWARDAVGEMQASGIMGGTGDNQFSPLMTYSAEQSLVTLKRLFDMVEQ